MPNLSAMERVALFDGFLCGKEGAFWFGTKRAFWTEKESIF